MLEILSLVAPRFGSLLVAYAWYRSEPLPGFSGRNAMQLVAEDRAIDVVAYVNAIDDGVFA
jgi:hypothetical protein